jgi:hypothetical protein
MTTTRSEPSDKLCVAAERKLGKRLDEDALLTLANPCAQSSSDECAELVDDAVATRKLSDDDAHPILGRQVMDVTTEAVALERGYKPATVRPHRRRAEQRLASIVRSNRGVEGEVA